jgi:hypothetical protein
MLCVPSVVLVCVWTTGVFDSEVGRLNVEKILEVTAA